VFGGGQEGEYETRGGKGGEGGPSEGSNVRALGRGCCNEVDGDGRRGGSRWGARRRMTRKGKEREKGGGGRTGVPYIKVKESESQVSLNAYHRLAAAAVCPRWGGSGLAERWESGALRRRAERTKGALRNYCTCALHSLALLAKRRPRPATTGWGEVWIGGWGCRFPAFAEPEQTRLIDAPQPQPHQTPFVRCNPQDMAKFRLCS
jgi:hypothetical protein